jgi:hypothetical protein
MVDQIADTLDREIGRRRDDDVVGIERVMVTAPGR